MKCASVIFISGRSPTASFTLRRPFGRIFASREYFQALLEYQRRRRRFGRTDEQIDDLDTVDGEGGWKAILAPGSRRQRSEYRLLIVLWWGGRRPWLFAAFFLILTSAALHEYFTIVFPDVAEISARASFSACALAGALLASDRAGFPHSIGLILLLGFCICPFLGGDLETRLRRLLWTVTRRILSRLAGAPLDLAFRIDPTDEPGCFSLC